MAKPPAFQFYVQDFLIGVRHFTAEEVGAYMLLLCEQWDNGFIENSTRNLKKITKISPKKLENVLKKFVQQENNLINLRLEQERNKRAEYSAQQRERANNRWKSTDASALPESCQRSTETVPPRNALQSSTSSSTSIKKGDKGFAAPSLDELKAYFKENGYTEASAIKAFNYYASANWKDSKGNQVKNWKQKMISVWFRPENKASAQQLEIVPNSFMKRI